MGRIRSDQKLKRVARVDVVKSPDDHTYVDTRTGAILWIDVDPPESDSDGYRPSGP